MDIITLRNVGSFEIPDTFRSILRISPNNGVDDPSELLSSGADEIQLSTSEGTLLPLTFVSKSAECEVVNRPDNKTDLINIVHDYDKLFITKSLNIRPTLYIEPKDRQVPLQFVNDGNSLGYPVEAPANTEYFNYNKTIPHFNSDKSILEHFNGNMTDSDYDSIKEKAKKIEINGNAIYRYLSRYSSYPLRVQDLDYSTTVLGVYPGNTYHQNSANNEVHNLSDNHHGNNRNLHTQMSYLPLDTLIWKTIEAYMSGKYRNYKGRYFNLSKKTSNELGKKLFGNGITDANIKDKAPLMGTSVQSGTIHYNAIPAHRYFYHIGRRYLNSSNRANYGINSAMNKLCKHYVLCDGKDIRTDYPNVSFDPGIIWTDTHEAIAKSTGSDSAESFKTPPLFEINQYAPRFLRGLNWLPVGNEFEKNTKTYKKALKSEDPANHSKNISEIGVYYANYDADLQRKYEHGHTQFAPKTFSGDITTLNAEASIFRGTHTSEVPSKNTQWEEYVKGSSDTFLGSQMLKTVGGLKKAGIAIDNFKEIQNAPITISGDTHGYFYTIKACIKYGKSDTGGCHNHKTPCHSTFSVRDGGYILARNESNKWLENGESWKKVRNVWRLTSSLPIQNKYGTPDILSENKLSKIVVGIETSDNTIYIDDSLPTPPAVNFIPLMKI